METGTEDAGLTRRLMLASSWDAASGALAQSLVLTRAGVGAQDFAWEELLGPPAPGCAGDRVVALGDSHAPGETSGGRGRGASGRRGAEAWERSRAHPPRRVETRGRCRPPARRRGRLRGPRPPGAEGCAFALRAQSQPTCWTGRGQCRSRSGSSGRRGVRRPVPEQSVLRPAGVGEGPRGRGPGRPWARPSQPGCHVGANFSSARTW